MPSFVRPTCSASPIATPSGRSRHTTGDGLRPPNRPPNWHARHGKLLQNITELQWRLPDYPVAETATKTIVRKPPLQAIVRKPPLLSISRGGCCRVGMLLRTRPDRSAALEEVEGRCADVASGSATATPMLGRGLHRRPGLVLGAGRAPALALDGLGFFRRARRDRSTWP